MNIEQLQTAVAKAHNQNSKIALQAMQPAFAAVVAFDATFAQRVKASKAARGEAPTKLGKSKRQELADYDRDAIESERKLTEDLRRFERAETIIRILYSGLESDVKFWEKALKHFHKAEMPLGQEGVALKRKLMKEMSNFVAEYGEHER